MGWPTAKLRGCTIRHSRIGMWARGTSGRSRFADSPEAVVHDYWPWELCTTYEVDAF